MSPHMKSSNDFAGILSQLLDSGMKPLSIERSYPRGGFTYNAGWESSLEPFALAELLGKTSIFKTSAKKYKPSFVRPSHDFNAEQKQAFAALIRWAPALKDNFTKTELRSGYRQALLKTHPDQGGLNENFWAVKKSYEILRSFVKSRV